MVFLFEHQILDSVRNQKGHTIIRKQRCLGCNKTLAIEITNKLGTRGEYYVVKDALRGRGGVDFLFAQEVWFGNLIICPNCRRMGKLPMDKPLTAEELAKKEEELNARTKSAC